jgi:hypothetical protein
VLARGKISRRGQRGHDVGGAGDRGVWTTGAWRGMVQ